ncbi:MAG: asparagine synthase-related protein [Pannonibacter sp.]
MLLSLTNTGDARDITPIDLDGRPAAGAIFGRLFERSELDGQSARVNRLSQPAAQALFERGSEELFSQYWGRYIAFLRAGTGWSIITDPTSSIPCFQAMRCGVTLVFSHLEACDFLDRTSFTVNYGFLSQLLAYDRIQTGETGLNEVRELSGGERLLITPAGNKTDKLWDPRILARDPLSLGVPDAAGLLYRTTRDVVEAWQASTDETLISLSGGLDSAIVLACLREAGGKAGITALHHHLGDSDLPEAELAREAARRAGCNFHMVKINPVQSLPDPEGHPLSARPFRQYLGSSLATQLGDHPERPGSVIFTGQGGDHLFLKSQSALGFSDYISHRGPASGILRELVNASRLSGQPAVSVLRAHFAGAERRPIEQRPTGRGKLEQVQRLAHLWQLREPIIRSTHIDIVHPLISQPLVELCLRLPVYVLAAGGISRGLARLAFKDKIPESIRLRMTKGSASGHFSEVLAANASMLDDTLSGGALASAGLLAEDAFRPLLEGESHRVGSQGGRLLVMFTIEAWLRRWRRELSKARS